MGAKTFITQGTTLLETLKELVEVVQNPGSIEEAYATARKEFELTSEQQKKFQEAQAIIANADKVRSEIEEQKKALEAEKADHDKNITESKTALSAEDLRLSELAATLDKQKEEFLQRLKKHHEDATKLADYKVSIAADKAQVERILTSREAAVKHREDSVRLQAEDLVRKEKELQEKIANIKNLVG